MGFLSLLLFFGFSSSACSPIGLFQYSECVHCKCLMKKLTETCTELREIHVVFVGMEYDRHFLFLKIIQLLQ